MARVNLRNNVLKIAVWCGFVASILLNQMYVGKSSRPVTVAFMYACVFTLCYLTVQDNT
jgi:hypothetical protein